MRIDVFHDTACPWCRIGKRQLHLALNRWEGEAVVVAYHPFFLNPDIPPQGYDFRQYMTAKGGERMPLKAWFDAPRRMGAAVGLTFRFEQITRAPNTLLSHRLIALAPPAQREAVMDAVYGAYFEHGQDIGALSVLVEVAAGAGLDREATWTQLESDAERDNVLAAARQAQELGISGVPFFVLGNRLAFSGALPAEQILTALRQAQTMRAPAADPNT